jgi:hypothetical protein
MWVQLEQNWLKGRSVLYEKQTANEIQDVDKRK